MAMTDINHADLSRQLALALGYAPESVQIRHPGNVSYCYVYRDTTPWPDLNWRIFRYTDPTVVVPLIKWLMVEHGCWMPHWRNFSILGKTAGVWGIADTLEEAVARAVIAVRKGE